MKITIPQKTSNSGSIYDLASEDGDIIIDMGNKYRYAVITPSYYNITPTRHINEQNAIRQAKSLQNLGYACVTIIGHTAIMYGFDKSGELYELER